MCHIPFPPESGINSLAHRPCPESTRGAAANSMSLKVTAFVFLTHKALNECAHSDRPPPMQTQELASAPPSLEGFLLLPTLAVHCIRRFPEGLRPGHCSRHLGESPALLLMSCANLGRLLSLSGPVFPSFWQGGLRIREHHCKAPRTRLVYRRDSTNCRNF